MTEYFTYINNRLCVAARWLYSQELGGGVMSRDTYDKLQSRNRINVVIRGGGLGVNSMVEFESLRSDHKEDIKIKLGCEPSALIKDKLLKGYLVADDAALKFFADHIYGEVGYEKSLPPDVQYEYYANAVVLNAIRSVLLKKRQVASLVGGKVKNPWKALTEAVKDLNTLKSSDGKRLYPHDLSENERVLERQYKKYITEGYAGLIHKNYGNESAIRLTEMVENLLFSIAVMETKPYMTSKYDLGNSVHGIYLQFLGGGLEIRDIETGEIFQPKDFCDKKGEPLTISRTTVQNYLTRPEIKIALDKARNSELYYTSKHRPIHHRHAPNYSFSKLTMDDIAIPFKRHDGTRVWAYQVFDTLSTCVVGRAYSADKGVDMLIDSLKDMMKFCVKNGWGFPGEIECEQSLANTLTGKENKDGTFTEDLLTAGTLFPFVSFQRGGMPQGKRAEGFIKTKKYAQQATHKGFQRRPFSLLEANRLNTDNNKLRFTIKEIVKTEEEDIYNYNHMLHPDQELYKGKTRWQVLIENVNPNLASHPMPVLAFYLGERKKDAKVHRSQWIRADKKDYLLPSSTIVKRLNSLTVDAYFIEGMNEVHVYQNNRFICTCKEVEEYNEAKIERTAEDEAIILGYEKDIAKFDKMTKDNLAKGAKLELIKIDKIADELEDKPHGQAPIHGEFDEPDLETQKQEIKEFKKAERQRVKANNNTKDAFFNLIDDTDFGD